MSSFYQSIGRYYDRIFPVGQAQLDLLNELSDSGNCRILDVACGTGSYSRELFLQGHEVIAIDNDDTMIEIARQKTPGLDVRLMGMEDIHQLEGGFDVIFCIGNSLVHLDSLEKIERFVYDAYQLLHTDGSLLIQIVNFERILSQDIPGLPSIDYDELSFERFYHSDGEFLDFHTKLEVSDGSFENHQRLFPIQTEQLIEAFEKAGFIGIQVFENFYGDSYDVNTSMFLITLATK